MPTEAGLDHRTMRICFEELRRSQEVSPLPNFLILLGDRYGWRPLPETNAPEPNDFHRHRAWRTSAKWTNSPYYLLEVAKHAEPESTNPEAKEWDAVADLLTDFQFLEAKAEAQMTYELVTDYRSVEQYLTFPNTVLRRIAPFAQFTQRKAVLFSARPDLVFQEAANQPSASLVAAAALDRQARSEVRRPWID